jgi:hypothetical protein
VKFKVIISMDWEGTGLEEKNLMAIRNFKERWRVPIVHYHNPAYYTHPYFCASEVHAFTSQAFFEDDEIALHLHTPQHLLDQAKVEVRHAPCFSRLGDYNPGPFKGQEVMLLAYPKDDVKKLIEFSLALFKVHGLGPVQSFRAGGWMADERVWEALAEVGIFVESSAANRRFLKGSSWEGDNLDRYSELLWGNRGSKLFPFILQTFSGQLLEIPNNLGAIDYWNTENIYQTFNELLSTGSEAKGPYREPVLVINSHQETAAEHLPKLHEFLAYLHGAYGDQISFVTNRDIYFERLEQTASVGDQYA